MGSIEYCTIEPLQTPYILSRCNHMLYSTIRFGDGRATEFWRMIRKVDWPCFRSSGSSSRGWRLGSSGDSTLQYLGYRTGTSTEYRVQRT